MELPTLSYPGSYVSWVIVARWTVYLPNAGEKYGCVAPILAIPPLSFASSPVAYRLVVQVYAAAAARSIVGCTESVTSVSYLSSEMPRQDSVSY